MINVREKEYGQGHHLGKVVQISRRRVVESKVAMGGVAYVQRAQGLDNQ